MNRKRRKQYMLHDFPNGFQGARIFADNRWVKLAKIIPWELVYEEYDKSFTDKKTGNPAIDSRIAFGALTIKQMLNISDEETVTFIKENPHAQYFLGLDEFTNNAPFDASKMVAFRRRFNPEAMTRINEAIIWEDKQDPPATGNDSGDDEPGKEESGKNEGTLLLDATCAPANIQYPTDVGLLNEARETSETLIDLLWESKPGIKKPRTYRQKARQNYLHYARNKKPGKGLIRKTIGKQLRYLGRNLKTIDSMLAETSIDDKQKDLLATIRMIYLQQKEMHEQKKHQTDDRIVSVHQPWVRPIVRGKKPVGTEFGAKIAVSMEDGYARIEKFSFDAFNEATTLIESCERYKERHGHYPERVLADKIYRNRANLQYCGENEIHLNGPKLGRPPKDRILYETQKRLEREEAGERNAIEGKFGEGKQCYGLGRVMAQCSDTSETMVHLVFVVMNLKKRLRSLFALFFQWIQLSRYWSFNEILPVGQ